MLNLDLPRGRYVQAAIGISPESGGQTRAMLMRNRIFVRETHVTPLIATVGTVRDPERQRAQLLDRGMLIEELPLANIYEHYRDHGWADALPTGEPAPDLGRFKTEEETHSDGTPWRVCYRVPSGRSRRVYDYLRPDGSPFLRVPAFRHADRRTWPRQLLKLDGTGEVVGSFDSVGAWYRGWLRELAPADQPAFVFVDTRRLVPHVVPMPGRHLHLVYLMHNLHVQEPRRWNSPVNEIYAEVLRRIGGMDAMVTLTHRQSDDIAQRRGATTNMYVVPNPVDLPPLPDPAPDRDQHRVTVVARLGRQKRLDHAIEAFARVLKEVPEAHLDVYGEGSERPQLEAQVAEQGLEGRAVLHGHEPRAREALWRSSAFLMTSQFEGYPLATLESMSHGCPVVAYDIKYGPREQISDGVDGFLVPAGDIDAAADRVTRLLRSPELVTRMGAAARRKAEHHGTDTFLRDWATVLHAAQRQKPYRTTLHGVRFRVTSAGAAGAGRLATAVVDRLPGAVPARLRRVLRGRARRLTGVLTVEGTSPRSSLESATLSLSAVDDGIGTVVELPVAYRRRGSEFHIRAQFRLDELPERSRQDVPVRLRLRLVWENRSWTTTVQVPSLLS